MDAFDKPVDFRRALLMREVRGFVPTDMSHAELAGLGHAIRERSLMMARVANAEFGDRVLRLSNRIIEGSEGEAKARLLLSDLLDGLGYEPEHPGRVTDLSSDQRLNLILRMQVQMADGFAQWRARQSAPSLMVWPAFELYRQFERREHRNWPERWSAAGGDFYPGDSDYPEGRMVARADSPIWSEISAFGTPYPPFDFNSGMGLRKIQRAEAEELGVVRRGEVVPPQRRDFERDAAAGAQALSEDIERVLLESLGPGWERVGDTLRAANERAIEEFMANAHIREYTKTSKSGKVFTVREHEDSRAKRQSVAAPKGEPTGSEEFKKWFAGSKAVNDDGTPKVFYRGTAERQEAYKGGGFFTDSKSDASEYAELAAIARHVDENEELSDIIGDIQAEEGGETLTDLGGADRVREIAEANDIKLPESTKGNVEAVYLSVKNPLDLRGEGSSVGKVSETWDRFQKAGLLREGETPWSEMDDDAKFELREQYKDKALYKFLEEEGVQARAFSKGHDAVVFIDQSLSGKSQHDTWLVKESTSVKSTANRGTWDPADEKIANEAAIHELLADMLAANERSVPGYIAEPRTPLDWARCDWWQKLADARGETLGDFHEEASRA